MLKMELFTVGFHIKHLRTRKRLTMSSLDTYCVTMNDGERRTDERKAD